MLQVELPMAYEDVFLLLSSPLQQVCVSKNPTINLDNISNILPIKSVCACHVAHTYYVAHQHFHGGCKVQKHASYMLEL